MQEVPVSSNIAPQQQTASTTTTAAGNSEHPNNGTSNTSVQPLAQAPVTQPAPAKPKKKRANPVYITPVRRERKRSCTDSDNEDGLTGDDCAWGPGGKRKKGGKKKAGAGGKGKGRKSKKDDSDWTGGMTKLYCVWPWKGMFNFLYIFVNLNLFFIFVID